MPSARLIRLFAIIVLAFFIANCQSHQPSTAASSGVPTHVLSYTFFGVNGVPKGEPTVDVASAAKWTTWAMSNIPMSRQLHAAGMKTIFYTNPNRVAPRDRAIYSSDESQFAHDCSGKRILVQKGEERYLTDPTSPAAQRSWKSFADQAMSQGQFDAIFDDTAASTGSLSGLPCNFDESKWIDEHVAFVQSLGVPVMVNALGDGDLPHQGKGPDATYSMSPILQIIARASNVMGGTFEDCYASPSHPSNKGGDVTAGSYWQQTENTELAVARLGKIFVCNQRAAHKAMADAIPARTYAEASFLLTYDLKSSMIRTQFISPSWFNLGPEIELVALDPVAPTPQTIDSLRTSGGAYGREYRSCYIAGSPVGPCAAAVNPVVGGSRPFPFSGYTHTMVLQGAGILDGGTISSNGPAPGSIASLTGVVAFK